MLVLPEKGPDDIFRILIIISCGNQLDALISLLNSLDFDNHIIINYPVKVVDFWKLVHKVYCNTNLFCVYFVNYSLTIRRTNQSENSLNRSFCFVRHSASS